MGGKSWGKLLLEMVFDWSKKRRIQVENRPHNERKSTNYYIF
jgi:hypothetical protein